MRKALSFLMLITTVSIAFTQETESEPSKHYIGLSRSVAQGSGFTYRYSPNRFGFQIAALPIFFENGDSYFSLGFTALYTLNSSKRLDLNAYISNAYNISNTTTYTYIDEWGYEYTYNSFGSNALLEVIGYQPGYNASLGLGIDFQWIPDKLILSIQMGYALTRIDTGRPLTQFNSGIGLFFKL
jgi:hypothetical protein